MPSIAPPSKSDREWQAEDDFRTLTSAEEVTADKGRLTRAKVAGRKLVKKEQAALKRKERVAGKPASKKPRKR